MRFRARTESLDQRSTQNHKSLLGNVQDSYFSYMKRLTVVLDTVTRLVLTVQNFLALTDCPS